MVIYCYIRKCKNYLHPSNDVSYHEFPSNEDNRIKWIQSLISAGCKITEIKSKSTLCSMHFNLSDYKNGVVKRGALKANTIPTVFQISSARHKRSNFLIKSDRKKLKPNAIPSILSWSKRKVCIKEDVSNTLGANPVALNVTLNILPSDPLDHLIVNASTVCEKKTSDASNKFTTNSHEIQLVDKADNVYIKDNTRLLSNNLHFNERIFSMNNIKQNDNEVYYYTGFTNYTVLQICLNMLLEYRNENLIGLNNMNTNKINQDNMTSEDEFLLVLIRLRQNFNYEHLSKLFNISTSSACNIFISWINLMYLKLGSLDFWPHRDVILSHSSNHLKKNGPTVVGSIDAIEIFLQTPSLELESETSNYKHHNYSVKGLTAVDCNGSVIFVSALCTGPISDSELIQKSGFIKVVESKFNKGYLLKDDTFLADKGFTINELIMPLKIALPVFRVNNVQFSVGKVCHTKKIAYNYVNMEKAIGCIKNYKILSSEVFVSELETFNQVWTVCCLLTNFKKLLRPLN